MPKGYKYLFCSSCKKVFDVVPCRHYTKKGIYDTYSCPFCGKDLALDVCPEVNMREEMKYEGGKSGGRSQRNNMS